MVKLTMFRVVKNVHLNYVVDFATQDRWAFLYLSLNSAKCFMLEASNSLSSWIKINSNYFISVPQI